MSDVIHRVTGVFLRSVNEPDYPTDTWLHNPDLSAVAGVDRRWWVVDGNTVREASATEKDAQIDAYKAERIAQVISLARAKIDATVSDYAPGEMAGWESAEAQASAYVSEETAQSTSPDLYAEAQHRGTTTGDIVARVLANASAFRALKAAIAGHRGRLTDQIAACTTVAQVDAIDIDAGWAI